MNAIEYAWWFLGAVAVAALSLWAFVALLRRVRRGRLGRMRAACLLAPTLLFPVPYLAVIVGLHMLANRMKPWSSVWSGEAWLGAIGTAAVLLGGIGVLNIVFWLALLFCADRRARAAPPSP